MSQFRSAFGTLIHTYIYHVVASMVTDRLEKRRSLTIVAGVEWVNLRRFGNDEMCALWIKLLYVEELLYYFEGGVD